MAKLNRRAEASAPTPTEAAEEAASTVPATAPIQPTATQTESASVVMDVALEAAPKALPKVPASPPFFLMVHPKRVTVLAGRVVCDPGQLTASPGIQGVDGRGGKVRVQASIAAHRENGWTILPHNIDGDSYLRRTKVRGGFAHHTRFETLNPGSRDTNSDVEGYVEWLTKLTEQGKAPKPARHAVERLRRQVKRRCESLSKKALTDPVAKLQLEKAVEEVKAVDAYLAKED